MESFYTEQFAFKQAKQADAQARSANKDGHWYARLVSNNPRIVRSFPDHEGVARLLVEAGEEQTLVDIACGGYLDAPDSRIYRGVFKSAVAG